MIASKGLESAGKEAPTLLTDIEEILCYLPREDVCGALELALLYAAASEDDAHLLVEQAERLNALPVNERWELGHELIRKLSTLAVSGGPGEG